MVRPLLLFAALAALPAWGQPNRSPLEFETLTLRRAESAGGPALEVRISCERQGTRFARILVREFEDDEFHL